MTIRFKNTNFDSLKLNHYVSTENIPDLIRDLPKKKYTFKITEGEYHTIWVTNANIHKGLFIEGSPTLREFDLELNLLDPDVLNIYWNKEEEEYYMSRWNYEDMMNSFKVE